MGFVNQSEFTDGAPGQTGASLDFVLILNSDFAAIAIDSPGTIHLDSQLVLTGEFVASARDHYVNDAIDAAPILSGDFAPNATFPIGVDLQLGLSGDFAPVTELRLVQPEPILSEISATAFQNKRLKVRLLINGTAVPFRKFRYAKQKDAAGAELSVEMSRTALSQIPDNASIKFEIGKFVSGSYQWHTLIDSGKLSQRSYRIAWLNNALNFSSIEPLANRLALCPRLPLIVYDGAKVSVSVSDLDALYDEGGNVIPTNTANVAGLNLYNLLNTAFVEGCGFTSFETNIPNYEVERCDFTSASSYLDAVAALIGVFKPVIIPLSGGGIRILDRTQIVPTDFSPVRLTANKYVSFGASKNFNRNLDGYELQYVVNQAGNYSVTRFVQPPPIVSGAFGDSNYTRTEINQIWRDWKDSSNTVIKSELESETRTTYNSGENITGRKTESYTFDAQSKRISSLKVLEANLPNLNAGGSPALLTVRRESQEFLYTTDKLNPTRVVPAQTITRISGLIAIDSENKYFDEDFKQDFLKAHEAGNLAASMTSDFGPIKTVIETFTVLGNGQVHVDVSGTDHLRDAPLEPVSEPRTGDISISGKTSKIQKMRIYRAGVDTSAASGGRIVPFHVGPMPLVFAKPLAERTLALEISPKDAGSVEFVGFDESLDQGVCFGIEDAAGNFRGNFLTEGFSIEGDSQKITTTAEVQGI